VVGHLVLPGRFLGAVFDMDGLLLDSESAWESAERTLVVGHGAEFTEADRIASIGRSIDASVAIYLARIGWPEIRQAELRSELLSLARQAYATIRPQPGAVELLRALRGRLRLALASNTDRLLVEVALPAAGIANVFDVIVTAEDVARPKPAPDLFALACTQLGVPPGKAIAFEDSETGVRSAKEAGLYVVAVPSFIGIDVSAADLVLSTLSGVAVDRSPSPWQSEGSPFEA
jgi:HAD superfamily hydrolase (TIGR01509 family)